MASKAQAKASSEYAKYMKDRGIRRQTARCPINHHHFYPIPNGIENHLRTCKG